MDTEKILTAYIACALWSSTTDDGEPLDDDHDADDIAPAALDEMRADVTRFYEFVTGEEIGAELGTMTPEQFGHDFWLTRNHHGAGFWDRGLGELGETLTTWAHAAGSSDLYLGDDGRIYVA